MVYVKRDSRGAIVAVSQQADGQCQEAVDPGDPAVRAFMAALAEDQSRLDATDQDFVRVLEDVVELLIAKGLILFTELPDSAQQKIMNRQRLRSELSRALDLIGDD